MSQPRPAQPRIQPVDEFTGEAAEIVSSAITGPDDQPLNIFGTLAHHPKLMKRFNLFGGYLLTKGLVPAREREIVILRIGWNARSVYEFGQHTVIGGAAGLTDDEIAALGSDDPAAPGTWSEDDLLLIALADELHADDCVGEDTYAGLAKRWTEAELIELVVCAGFYRLVSGFLNTMGVQLDDGVPGWPSSSTA
ncbi:MAG: carboxymuconolactone decarboxylase family protein [Acidimicrobiales bacterium]